jgi:hypothetical protein
MVRGARRPVTVGIGVIVIAGCLSGCEPGKDFWITNGTTELLTVQSRTQVPGAALDPVSPIDQRFTLQPGQKIGLQIDLSRGVCKDVTFLAEGPSGQLVAQDPSPICEDKAGHGNSWTIKTK